MHVALSSLALRGACRSSWSFMKMVRRTRTREASNASFHAQAASLAQSKQGHNMSRVQGFPCYLRKEGLSLSA